MQQHNRRKDIAETHPEAALTVEVTLARPSRRRVTSDKQPPELTLENSANRIPRIARLMALAIRFQEMVERGEVRDYAGIACLGHVSRARITQIMNLLNLAPTLQENILLKPPLAASCVSERSIRKITGLVFWEDQLDTWNGLLGYPSPPTIAGCTKSHAQIESMQNITDTLSLAKGPASGFPLVRFETFIQAIRDSGYKGTPSAIAELVDNAIEAQASSIAVDLIPNEKSGGVTSIHVRDDGHGMIPTTLQTALQFGGSTRFNSRNGYGRLGMGLPCSSLSIAQRVDVYTWTVPRRAWWSYLDANQVSKGGLNAIPRPQRRIPPAGSPTTASGTLIELSRCDRLDYSRIAHLERKLHAELGRIFRYPIQHGVRITINGEEVKPADPLFLVVTANRAKAQPFGPPLLFPVRVPGLMKTSVVQVRFSELPVTAWHNLPNAEKRKMGISKGAGVSVIRAGREVDYGWFFMGSKRRENYDDWWRCEVHYEPVLDEVFGLTHTKQRIRPAELLEQVMTPDHCCPVKSQTGSTGCDLRLNWLGSQMPPRPVKWALFQKA